MDRVKKLKPDMDELGSAMEDGSYEHDYYLDLETGEILLLSEYMDDKDIESLKEKIEDDPDRYEKIPKAESHDGYQDMQEFIATIGDEHTAEVLDTAIQGSGAFRRFKDALLRYPEERERWFKFKNERMHERVLEWLSDIGVSVSEE
jgi:hypothetical protein